MGAALRRIQVGNALGAFGSGFTVPFLFVYVARVRELGSGTAGAVLAVFALSALVVLPFIGRVIDRRGPMPVGLAGAFVASAGALGFGLSSSAGAVMASSALMGGGIAVIHPALATMIVWCSTHTSRSRAFATQFFLNNLGLGVGGLLGGLMVDEHRPGTFTLLFVVEATMFLVLAGVLATTRLPRVSRVVHSGDNPTASAPEPAATGGGGWRTLARDRAMVLLCVLGFVMFFACYGQFESGLSAYAVEVTRISTSTLGIALAANTATIVVAQFVVLRWVEGRRRSRVIALVGLVWTVAWVAAGVSGLVAGSHVVATALLISTYALFGLGESMLSPTVAPLVADLAPRPMVGRYNSALALVKQCALALGPAVGGLMAAAGVYGAYIAMLVGCSLGITALALWLGRRLTPVQDNPLVRLPEPAVAEGREAEVSPVSGAEVAGARGELTSVV
ncbi:MFS transporter [Streptomyces sp. NPDC005438]|uniref:MFS transporter n=1 Tax=Streptomyces sp. NPDC005438 TaxID=3156880 RepID=UPI0033BE0D69